MNISKKDIAYLEKEIKRIKNDPEAQKQIKEHLKEVAKILKKL